MPGRLRTTTLKSGQCVGQVGTILTQVLRLPGDLILMLKPSGVVNAGSGQ